MKSQNLVHLFQAASAGEIYSYLADLRKFVSIHPFMKTATVIAQPTPQQTVFHITETAILLGFIPYPVVYDATVTETESDKTVEYFSDIKKMIQLAIHWRVEKTSPGEITVFEKVEVTGNKLLSGVFIKLLAKAHLKSMENLKLKLKNVSENHPI